MRKVGAYFGPEVSSGPISRGKERLMPSLVCSVAGEVEQAHINGAAGH